MKRWHETKRIIYLQLFSQKAKEQPRLAKVRTVKGFRRKHRPAAPLRRFLGKRQLACPAVVIALCLPASAQDFPSFDNFGGTGLLDMPSATMAPDGHLVLNASYQQYTQHYNLTFQALPWLETSFRYSGLQHYDRDYPVYWDRAFAVKVRFFEEGNWMPAISAGINDLVGTGIYSSEYVVATKNFGAVEATVGMGWGRLSSAAPFRNPLSLLSKSFDDRAIGTTGTGGDFSFGKYFHGPAGIFGGLIWHTPIEKLDLKAEYSSDNYSDEASRGGFSPRSQFNLGASYRAFGNMIFGVNWMYGRSVGGSVTFDLSPNEAAFQQRVEPPPIPLNFRSPADQAVAIQTLKGGNRQPMANVAARSSDALWQAFPSLHNVAVTGATLEVTLTSASQEICRQVLFQIDPVALHVTNVVVRNDSGSQIFRCAAPVSQPLQSAVYRPDGAVGLALTIASEPLVIDAAGPNRQGRAGASAKLRKDAEIQRLHIETVTFDGGVGTIYYINNRYQAEAEAVDKLLRLAMADMPNDIEEFRFVAVQNGLTLAQYTVLRAVAERSFQQESNYSLLDHNSGPMPAPTPWSAVVTHPEPSYPRFSWSIFPQLRQEFFDPENPLGFQLVAGATATVELLPGLALSAEVEASMFDTFNSGRVSDSVLPHVRTDFLEYFNRGKNGIGDLHAEYRFRFSPTVFARVRAGYLESMFGGVGGEVLWRPEGQRWAVGADLYEVKQRAYDRLFGFLPYRQTTGHVTIYYDSPWYDLDFQLRAGQYLAGDRGVTFQVSRRFSTGVEVGLFATKTNVSAARFGEGSFDKGIFLRIPIDWVLPIHSQTALVEVLRPVQRDGGQLLAGDAVLFDLTRRNSESDALSMRWN